MAAAYSVPDADLAPAAIRYPTGRRGETFAVRPNPQHLWFFKYAQQPDQVLLIKIFDSDQSTARRVPHSSFEDPATEGEDARQSVEVRAVVVYDLD